MTRGATRRIAAPIGRVLALAMLAACALPGASPAGAAAGAGSPAAASRRSAAPAAPAIAAPVDVTILTADSVRISGRWYPGPPRASTVVLPPRRRGPDPELLEVAAGFQRRGFNALTFTLRDPAVSDPSRDSLRYVVLASHWVDDAAAALREARDRTDGTARVFEWGQGLAGVLSVAAAARSGQLCDGLAVENLFRFVGQAMRDNGTAVIADAQARQGRVLAPRDEPYSAAARLALPAYAVLTGPGAGAADDATLDVLRRNHGRLDRWMRPWVSAPGQSPTPAEVDTLADWFRRWASIPRAQ